jgi:hypothetical protein
MHLGHNAMSVLANIPPRGECIDHEAAFDVVEPLLYGIDRLVNSSTVTVVTGEGF